MHKPAGVADTPLTRSATGASGSAGMADASDEKNGGVGQDHGRTEDTGTDTTDEESGSDARPEDVQDGLLPFGNRSAVRRPDDLLVLDFSFRGFNLVGSPPSLVRTGPDAYFVVHFPPQSFGEQAFLQTVPTTGLASGEVEHNEVSSHPSYPSKNASDSGEQLPSELPAARVRMAGKSRVAVTMPVDRESISFTSAALLDALATWPMRLDENARPDPSLIPFEGPLGLGLVEAASRLVTFSADSAQASPSRFLDAVSEEVAALQDRFPALRGQEGTAATAEALHQTIQPLVATPDSVTETGATIPWLAATPGPRVPSPDSTALELPYRLVVTPLAPAKWHHALTPVTRHGRTELWHTRLGSAEHRAGADPPGRVRALWSPDYRPADQIEDLIRLISEPSEPPDVPQPDPDLLRMSLDPVDRSMLVTLMAGFDALTGGKRYRPISSQAKRLHLSALGALLEAEGQWQNLPDGIDLQQWYHLATLGRDQYVRVVYKGYLCPFGHSASLVKVTEREFQPLGGKAARRAAVLRQRFYIVVRQRVREFSGAGQASRGRTFPFHRVEILTSSTPNLAEPGVGSSAAVQVLPPGLAPRMLFWPMMPGTAAGSLADVMFDLAATDIVGQRTTFSMPLLFVGERADAQHADVVRSAYNATPATPRRSAAFGGSSVAFAPVLPEGPFDPRLPTEALAFNVGAATGTIRPRYNPEIETARVGIKPVQKLLSQPDFIAEVKYPEVYATSGFDELANAGQVFLQLTASRLLPFGSGPGEAKNDAIGALASPQMQIVGLSRLTGPVAGKESTNAAAVKDALAPLISGKFDPAAFFSDAKILGGVPLSEILEVSQNLTGTDVPKTLTRDLPDRIETRFEWNTPVRKADTRNLLIPRADPGRPDTRLIMNGIANRPLDPAAPASFQAEARLNNFKVNLFGFIILWFDEIRFSARDGQKPDVTVELHAGDDAVCFGGPLEFVNELRSFIPSNGFSDPPALTVTPSGIQSSFTLTLPAVQVGIFALSNAALGASFSLPFDSRPASVRFSFSERQSPFSLTVSLLGGGGFLALGVSSRGVTEIEAALEFGAAVAIDLGVASGGVEVKAGIYFHWLEPIPGKGSVDLAGYVRIHGELTIIGIISVSLTFNLQLGYHKEGGKAVVYGEATLIVEVDILMFSTSVSVACRREFGGGAADPSFLDLVPNSQLWAEYCASFAEEGLT